MSGQVLLYIGSIAPHELMVEFVGLNNQHPLNLHIFKCMRNSISPLADL